MFNKSDIEEYNLELWSEFLRRRLLTECRWTQIVYAASLSIIFVVSLVGNLLTCVVIYYDKSMHTTTNYYLFNMAVSDLIVSLGILPETYVHILYDTYQFSEFTCQFQFFLVSCLMNNSTLIMTALAIERYIAIRHPLPLQATPVHRRVKKILILISILAILEALPEMRTVNLIKSENIVICFGTPTNYSRILNGVLALVTFVFPLCIMMTVYTMIAFKVNVKSIRTSEDHTFNHRDNRGRVNKLVVALTVSFMVCWVPYFLWRVLIFAYDVPQLIQLSEWWTTLLKSVMINSWFSIVLNPLLFSLISSKFRKALKRLWKNRFTTRYFKT